MKFSCINRVGDAFFPLALLFSASESMQLCAVLRLSPAAWSLTLDFPSLQKWSHIVLFPGCVPPVIPHPLLYTELTFEDGALGTHP